eukprot:TRINITY_DN27499_c0_g1_i1.p1 TRINITY_DN27499_c0_g1~~TRINITY_DN27499_c0_g1_i1.p1  ORF type:complete len:821 (-),score=113.26 TRINITY_DN27499_c0_g1_i1:28-2490(-)
MNGFFSTPSGPSWREHHAQLDELVGQLHARAWIAAGGAEAAFKAPTPAPVAPETHLSSSPSEQNAKLDELVGQLHARAWIAAGGADTAFKAPTSSATNAAVKAPTPSPLAPGMHSSAPSPLQTPSTSCARACHGRDFYLPPETQVMPDLLQRLSAEPLPASQQLSVELPEQPLPSLQRLSVEPLTNWHSQVQQPRQQTPAPSPAPFSQRSPRLVTPRLSPRPCFSGVMPPPAVTPLLLGGRKPLGRVGERSDAPEPRRPQAISETLVHSQNFSPKFQGGSFDHELLNTAVDISKAIDGLRDNWAVWLKGENNEKTIKPKEACWQQEQYHSPYQCSQATPRREQMQAQSSRHDQRPGQQSFWDERTMKPEEVQWQQEPLELPYQHPQTSPHREQMQVRSLTNDQMPRQQQLFRDENLQYRQHPEQMVALQPQSLESNQKHSPQGQVYQQLRQLAEHLEQSDETLPRRKLAWQEASPQTSSCSVPPATFRCNTGPLGFEGTTSGTVPELPSQSSGLLQRQNNSPDTVTAGASFGDTRLGCPAPLRHEDRFVNVPEPPCLSQPLHAANPFTVTLPYPVPAPLPPPLPFGPTLQLHPHAGQFPLEPLTLPGGDALGCASPVQLRAQCETKRLPGQLVNESHGLPGSEHQTSGLTAKTSRTGQRRHCLSRVLSRSFAASSLQGLRSTWRAWQVQAAYRAKLRAACAGVAARFASTSRGAAGHAALRDCFRCWMESATGASYAQAARDAPIRLFGKAQDTCVARTSAILRRRLREGAAFQLKTLFCAWASLRRTAETRAAELQRLIEHRSAIRRKAVMLLASTSSR